MAYSTTLSIDLDTNQILERIREKTGLSKAEIARQAFRAFEEAITFGKAEIIVVNNQPAQA